MLPGYTHTPMHPGQKPGALCGYSLRRTESSIGAEERRQRIGQLLRQSTVVIDQNNRAWRFKSCLSRKGLKLKDFIDAQKCSYTAVYQALKTPSRSTTISQAIDDFIAEANQA